MKKSKGKQLDGSVEVPYLRTFQITASHYYSAYTCK